MGTPATPINKPSSTNRLPTSVTPTHYSINLLTDLSSLTYSGSSLISIRVLEPVQCIILHAASPLVLNDRKGFLIDRNSAWVGRKAKKRPLQKIVSKGEMVQLWFEGGEIGKGWYKLGLRWKGVLNASMKGYYLSTYPRKGAEQGETDVFACTQFQPTSARRAFPCFDEPSFKAVWRLSMISRVATTSLSNMHIDKVEPISPSHCKTDTSKFPRTDLLDADFYQDDDVEEKTDSASEKSGELISPSPSSSSNSDSDSIVEGDWVLLPIQDTWEIVHFAPTPLLSSYLVAFANGQLEYREDHFVSALDGKRKIKLRFYATWDQIEQTALALRTTKRLVPIYEKIFDIPFPLQKLDTLVINDFDLGAMENLGLQMGRTSAYCFDEQEGGSIVARKGVVSITSHEISHTWFGDVVTLSYWDSLWLNEAFATLMGECLMIDRLEPSWNIHSSFVSEHLGRALKLDALRSSHPIEVDVPDEAAISQAFDAISYSKGASVLKQLCNWLGEEKFLDGVRLYLKAHQWGNTVTADLWKGIEQSSGKDIPRMMEAWVYKIGFPYVKVEETRRGLKLTQHRFLSSGEAKPEEDGTIWHIPLQLLTVDPATGKKTIDGSLLLTQREMEIDLPDVGDKTYKLNAESCGVYRVLYPASRLARLGSEAASPNSAFSTTDRMGLVQDASILASSGYSKTSSFLTLARQLAPVEKEFLVFSELSSALSTLSSVWWEQDKDVKEAIGKVKVDWFGPVAKSLGMDPVEGEPLEETELRGLSWAALAASDDPDTITEFQRRFSPFLESNDASLIPSDLLGSMFRTCVAHGGEREYTKALEIVLARPNPSQFSAAVSALCSTRDSARLGRTFDFVLSKKVKTQDVAAFFNNLAMNPLGKRKMWELLKDHLDVLTRRFEGNFQGPQVIAKTFNTFTTNEDADEVERFFQGKDVHMFKQAMDQGIEAIRANAAWLSRDAQDVKLWLRENGYLSTS